MKCYVFCLPYANGQAGFNIRPVCWANPAAIITPMWIDQSPAVLEWINQHKRPYWNSYFDRKGNCISLANRLGYWPEPIEVDAAPIPDEFNDPIPW